MLSYDWQRSDPLAHKTLFKGSKNVLCGNSLLQTDWRERERTTCSRSSSVLKSWNQSWSCVHCCWAHKLEHPGIHCISYRQQHSINRAQTYRKTRTRIFTNNTTTTTLNHFVNIRQPHKQNTSIKFITLHAHNLLISRRPAIYRRTKSSYVSDTNIKNITFLIFDIDSSLRGWSLPLHNIHHICLVFGRGITLLQLFR